MMMMIRTTKRLNRKYLSIYYRTLSTSSKRFKEVEVPCVEKAGLVLGVYVPDLDPLGQSFQLTPTAKKFDEHVKGRLFECIRDSIPTPKLGEGKVFYGLHHKYSAIAVVGLGDECLCYNPVEQIDERKESIRNAAALGIRLLENVNMQRVYVESFGHAESAAEGASMGSWIYQQLKATHNRKYIKKLEIFDSCDFTGWRIGLHKAAAQNLARLLQETPANNLTPSTFAQTTIETLARYGISVNVRMQNWAKLRNLNAFLSVARGSCEPPVFLEILYEGCDPNICPIVLVGKGITFDSGGLCLRTCDDMQNGRGDISGAAVIIATFRAIAALQLPLNVRGLLPLCANVPGASSFKPGDIIKTHNGKTILVERTDCEGLLLLADSLSYSQEYNPKFVLSIGSLAPDTIATFSEFMNGVWCNNESLYEMMRIASMHTGDRIWRLPLWDYYTLYMKKPKTADLTNKTPEFTGGGASRSAAFLREFVQPCLDWIHIDNYNTHVTSGKIYHYLRKGMSGRPTRNLVEFLAQLACVEELPSPAAQRH